VLNLIRQTCAANFFLLDKANDLLCRPVHRTAVQSGGWIKTTAGNKRSPGGSQQSRVCFGKEYQRKLDMAKIQSPLMQVRLQQVRVAILDAVPPASLAEKSRGHKVNNVAATNNAFPQRLVCVLPCRVMMSVQPRRDFFVLQCLEYGQNQSRSILRAVRKKSVMGAAWEALDFPITYHQTTQFCNTGNGGTLAFEAGLPPVTAAISSSPMGVGVAKIVFLISITPACII